MKIIDIALKDLLRSFRSLFAVGMVLAAPLLITGLIYFAFGGLSSGGDQQFPPFKVVVVNLDEGGGNDVKIGTILTDFLLGDTLPDWMQVSKMDSEVAARTAVTSKGVGAAVIIPSNFTTAALGSGERAQLVMVKDPTLIIGPPILQDLLQQFIEGVTGSTIARNVVSAQMVEFGVQANPATIGIIMQRYTDWFIGLEQNLYASDAPLLAVVNPTGSGTDPMKNIMALIMAGQIIFFAFYTGAYTAESILREDEEGTLARLFTTPTSRSAILAGKFLAVFVTVIIQALVLLILSSLIFRIQWWQQPFTLILVILGLVISASGLGVLVMSFVRSTRQAGPVLGGLLTALGMVGGLFTVAVPMPAAFETITLFTPHGWVLRGARLMLDGAGPQEVLLPFLVCVAMGAMFFFAGSALFRRRFNMG
jgi:ABC-2 type transport system permease protein